MTTTAAMSVSVKVIIHDPQGRVLLLQRAQSSKNNPGKWEFPGGKIDPGEAFDVALAREVREETGLDIAIKGSFGTCESEVEGRRVIYLVLEAACSVTAVRLSPEHSASEWVAPEKLGELEFAPQFRRMARRYAQDAAIHPRVPPPPQAEGPEDLFKNSVVNPANLRVHLDAFVAGAPDRDTLAKELEKFLRAGVRSLIPMAQVTARPKDLISFARKLILKKKYKDPLKEVTDLIGARVVVHLPAEVDTVSRWIEQQFDLDQANSVDKLKDLGPDKFGYRAMHYVVILGNGRPAGLTVPPCLVGLKVEIQVRTIAQHAWSDIGHDRIYKADCDIPDYWKREANRIAALLEAADEEFARLVKGLNAYCNHVRACPDCPTAKRQLELWETVRAVAPQDSVVALKVARLACELEDWPRIVRVANECGNHSNGDLLCAKGYALCRIAAHPHTEEWKQGIADLTEAAKRHPARLEPRLRLGELLTPHDRDTALRFYSQAFQLDSGHPAVLAGYIRCKVLDEKTTAFLPLLRPDIEEAIRRCRDLVAAGADVPHAYYRIAGFLLLLGLDRGHEALEVMARAVYETQFSDILVRALLDLSALGKLLTDRVDIKCAVRFLEAALKAKYPEHPWPDDVPGPVAKPLDTPRPVIIVAGGCHAQHESAMQGYADLLAKALGAFRGTVLSGGTEQGISGVVGGLTKKTAGQIHSVGYLPKHLPTDGSATRDHRYTTIRESDGESGFTALEPLQAWLDLLAAGVRPEDVRLLGINGGNVAGLEYRIALALGAQVGLIQNSGREADRMVKEWVGTPLPSSGCAPGAATRPETERSSAGRGRLLVLPPDPMTLRAFILMGVPSGSKLEEEAIQRAAQLTHEEFLEEKRYDHPDPVMKPWPKLREDLRQSNLDQVRYLESILDAAGFGIRKVTGIPSDPVFTEGEIECMAEMEHGRWNVERLASGWRYGREKDAEKKITPWLLPWETLPPRIQAYDLQNVRLWPQRLAEVGYEIYRLRNAAQAAATSTQCASSVKE